jgi:hypothetical protein
LAQAARLQPMVTILFFHLSHQLVVAQAEITRLKLVLMVVLAAVVKAVRLMAAETEPQIKVMLVVQEVLRLTLWAAVVVVPMPQELP